MKFLRSGKVKDIYETEDGNLLFVFSDRVSAFDVKFPTAIPRKGEALCKFAEFWFNSLPIPNHYVRTESINKMVVKKMKMIPIECVVRGYFYGSLVERWNRGEFTNLSKEESVIAAKLSKPLFDPTTKSELHDLPIDRTEAIKKNLVTSNEYNLLEQKSIEVYKIMSEIVNRAGFILADLKLEFGKMDQEIVLGDSIGPDEYRLWLKESYQIGKLQESYDKQILRDWLAKNGVQKQFEDFRNRGFEPKAPELPMELCEKLSSRYLSSYSRITGHSL